MLKNKKDDKEILKNLLKTSLIKLSLKYGEMEDFPVIIPNSINIKSRTMDGTFMLVNGDPKNTDFYSAIRNEFNKLEESNDDMQNDDIVRSLLNTIWDNDLLNERKFAFITSVSTKSVTQYMINDAYKEGYIPFLWNWCHDYYVLKVYIRSKTKIDEQILKDFIDKRWQLKSYLSIKNQYELKLTDFIINHTDYVAIRTDSSVADIVEYPKILKYLMEKYGNEKQKEIKSTNKDNYSC